MQITLYIIWENAKSLICNLAPELDSPQLPNMNRSRGLAVEPVHLFRAILARPPK
jgi:hypothetical protein